MHPTREFFTGISWAPSTGTPRAPNTGTNTGIPHGHPADTKTGTASQEHASVSRICLLVPAPFLFSVHQHGMTFPFLSDRNPLWNH